MKLKEFNKGLKKEYDKTFIVTPKHKKEWHPRFKIRYAFLAVFVLITLFLTGEHLYCVAYNHSVKKYNESRFDVHNTTLLSIDSKEEYQDLVGVEKKPIESILTKMFTINYMLKGEAPGMDYNGSFDVEEGIPEAPGDNGADSFQTNIQTSGIDEADVAKSDGNYIYSIKKGYLQVFDLEGNLVDKSQTNNRLLYIKENKIITIGYTGVEIYHFEDNELSKSKKYEFANYLDSRLIGDKLYIVGGTKIDIDDEAIYDDLYYDGCNWSEYVYQIICYDLSTDEVKTVKNLNSGSVKLYMSKSHIYLATNVYLYRHQLSNCREITVISIFDLELNAVGALRIYGSVLNQFSMDEYNNYFRVVSTNTMAETERLNAISIFDLNSLERVGYLDEGIGLERQQVKSVSFLGDTCHVVTYEQTDPLYEIDLSDPTNPTIVSIYKAPGYSSYLKNFEIAGKKYLLGIGYDDDLSTRKISIYLDEEETKQIGNDFLISYYEFNGVDLLLDDIIHTNFDNHKALFIFNDGTYFYLGLKVNANNYYVFKIDVNSEEVVTIYSHYNSEEIDYDSRAFLINGKFYLINGQELIINDW